MNDIPAKALRLAAEAIADSHTYGDYADKHARNALQAARYGEVLEALGGAIELADAAERLLGIYNNTTDAPDAEWDAAYLNLSAALARWKGESGEVEDFLRGEVTP